MYRFDMNHRIIWAVFGLAFNVLPGVSNAQQVIAKGSWVAETPQGQVLDSYPTSKACVNGIKEALVSNQAYQKDLESNPAKYHRDGIPDSESVMHDLNGAIDEMNAYASANCVQQ